MTQNDESVLPIEAVLRKLQECVEKGGMTYHGGDIGVLAAGIVNALGLEQVGWRNGVGLHNDEYHGLNRRGWHNECEPVFRLTAVGRSDG